RPVQCVDDAVRSVTTPRAHHPGDLPIGQGGVHVATPMLIRTRQVVERSAIEDVLTEPDLQAPGLQPCHTEPQPVLGHGPTRGDHDDGVAGAQPGRTTQWDQGRRRSGMHRAHEPAITGSGPTRCWAPSVRKVSSTSTPNRSPSTGTRSSTPWNRDWKSNSGGICTGANP